MFGLFRSPPLRDPRLGELVRSRAHWRGQLALQPSSVIPLVISGTRSEPNAQALALARELPTQFALWRASIEQALFEHYEAYAKALAADELPPHSAAFPSITAANQVWPHVSLVFVSVTPLDSTLTAEFGITTRWDEEHILGARFQAGELLELCGSVLPP
jgi:hypothetical protein